MIIRRANEEQLRAALDVANEQFGGNLRFQKLEDLQALRTPKFKVRLDVEDLEGPGTRRGYLSYYYGHTHKPRLTRAACYHAYGAFLVALLERVPEAVIEAGARGLRADAFKGSKVSWSTTGPPGRPTWAAKEHPSPSRTLVTAGSTSRSLSTRTPSRT